MSIGFIRQRCGILPIWYSLYGKLSDIFIYFLTGGNFSLTEMVGFEINGHGYLILSCYFSEKLEWYKYSTFQSVS